MKVLFLTIGSNKIASTRFRVIQYLEGLSRYGVEVTHVTIPNAFIKRVGLIRHLHGNDLIVIQKKLFSEWELGLIKRVNPNIVFDFDDNITAPSSKNAGRKDSRQLKNEKRFGDTLRSAKFVIAGNSFLKDMALPYNPNVAVVPTPIDTERYLPAGKKKRDEVVVGWIGSKWNLFYLKEIQGALRRLCLGYNNVRLVVVCDQPFEADGVNVEFRPWEMAREISDLQEFDIGIMPLTMDNWSLGKCGFKLLQYMAVSIPVVASPVGANSEIVSHGLNGYLAGTEDEWVESLKRLVEDADLRVKMGSAGRKIVEERYSVRACLPMLKDIFTRVFS